MAMQACLGRRQFARDSPSLVTPGLSWGVGFGCPAASEGEGRRFQLALVWSVHFGAHHQAPGRLTDDRGAFLELRSWSCRSCAP
jgi:hypothetical protein